jgi:hypothetical protein
MVDYENFSAEGILKFGKIFSGPADHLLSKYLTFSGKGPNRYNGLRP